MKYTYVIIDLTEEQCEQLAPLSNICASSPQKYCILSQPYPELRRYGTPGKLKAVLLPRWKGKLISWFSGKGVKCVQK